MEAETAAGARALGQPFLRTNASVTGARNGLLCLKGAGLTQLMRYAQKSTGRPGREHSRQ